MARSVYVGGVRVGFEGDTSKLKRAAGDATRTMRTWGTRVDKERRTTERFNRAAGVMRSRLLAITGLFAGVFTVAGVQRAAETATQFTRISNATGIARDNIAGWARLFRQARLDIDDIRDITQDVVARVQDAATGTKSYVDALALAGLTAQDLIDRSPEEQLSRVLEAAAGLDIGTRTFFLDEILSDAGKRLATLSTETLASARDLVREGSRLQITASEEAAKSVKELTLEFDTMTSSVGGLVTEILDATGVLNALTRASRGWTLIFRDIAELFGLSPAGAGPYEGWSLDRLREREAAIAAQLPLISGAVFDEATRELAAIADAIARLTGAPGTPVTAPPPAPRTFANPYGTPGAFIGPSSGAYRGRVGGAGVLRNPYAGVGDFSLGPSAAETLALSGRSTATVSARYREAVREIRLYNESLEHQVEIMLEARTDLSEAFGSFAGDVSRAITAGRGSVREAAGRLIDAVLEAIIHRPLERAVTRAAGGIFDELAGRFDLGALFWATPRAGGGPVLSGRPYVVGERGPELFVPHTSGTIDPSAGPRVALTFAPVIQSSDTAAIRRALEDSLPGFVEAAKQATAEDMGRPSPLRTAVRSV